MTDWSQHQLPPPEERLRSAFHRALIQTMGWHPVAASLEAGETVACDEALAELDEPVAAGRRLVADGIKLNAGMYFTETRAGSRIRRGLRKKGAATAYDAPAVRAPAS